MAFVTLRAPPVSRKLRLQLAVAVAACVPVAGGLQGMVLGPGAGAASLDSHFRYLSGLLLGLGLLFWSAVPAIERRGRLIRTLTVMVVIGGLARAWSLFQVGLPGPTMRFALIMELVVTPALCLWQWRLARSMDAEAPLLQA